MSLEQLENPVIVFNLVSNRKGVSRWRGIRPSWRRMQGVTLTELIVVVTIVGILTAIAIPSFRTATQTNRFATQVNDLLGDLNLARSEASKRGVVVKVCRKGGTSCWNGCWKNGWTVFIDKNNDHIIDAGDTILRQHGPLEGAPQVADGIQGFFSFSPDGVSYYWSGSAPSSTQQSGVLAIYNHTASCSTNVGDNGGKIRRLVINSVGRVRLCQSDDSDGNCVVCPTPDVGC